MTTRWLVERHGGGAGALHALVPPADGRRRLWVLRPTRPAVVLGSTQPEATVDVTAATRAGVEVARRRSGGGAVWVAPDDPIWVDVFVPRGDPHWDDDVARAFLPVGRAWVEALDSVGVPDAVVHQGPMVHSEWSASVCFAGRGPGEVLLGGAKVVGISQRRTRAGARFQCAVPRRWDPEPLRALLRPAPPADEAARWGTGVGDLDADAVITALARALT